jgi:O-antigen ligase
MIIKDKINNITLYDIINYLILIYSFSIPLDKYITKFIALLLLVVWILEGDFKNKFLTIVSSRVIQVLFLFILFNYISVLWSNHPNIALSYVRKYSYFLPIIIIFTSIKKEYIKYVIMFYLSGLFLGEIITYGIYFNIWTTSYNLSHISPSPTAFMSHTIYSAMIAFGAILSLYNLITTDNKIFKLIFLFFYLSISINLFISDGRTGLVPFVFVQFILLIYIYRNKVKYTIVYLIAIFLLLYTSYNNIKSFNQRINHGYDNFRNAIEHKNFNSSFGTRMAMIYIGLQIFKDNPFIGVGIKDNMDELINYANNIKEYDMNVVKQFYKWHFHNQYIEILTQLGLIGLMLFLLIFYTLLKIKIEDNYLNTIKIIFVFSILFSIISSDLFHQRHYIHFIGLFIALILAQEKYERQEKIAL